MATTEEPPFPKSVADFRNDDRVRYITSKDKYILEASDGTTYTWDDRSMHWNNPEEEAVRSAEQVDQPNDAQSGTKRKAEDQPAPAKKPKKAPENKSIYVTGIPSDATFEDIHAVFKRYGQIVKNIDDESPRIKMYANEDGTFKGEALITYFQALSVDQAINLADGTDFREPLNNGDMRVQQADMSYKKVQEYDHKAPKTRRSKQEKEKIKRMTAEMQAKLEDWDSDDPQQDSRSTTLKPRPNKFDKLLVVRNVFTLYQMETEDNLASELEEDFVDQAKEENWGDVISVTVFDKEPLGIVRVRFREAESALKAAELINGRSFGGRTLSAYIPDKKEKFRKTPRDPEEEERRLEAYGKSLNNPEEDEDNEDEK